MNDPDLDITPQINIIASAMMEERLLEFTYTDAKGLESRRRVEPYEVKADTGIHELFAADVDKGLGLRRFRLVGMRDWSLGEAFKPSKPMKIPTGP